MHCQPERQLHAQWDRHAVRAASTATADGLARAAQQHVKFARRASNLQVRWHNGMQSYPRKLAYEYLEELANEFGRLYGPQVDAVARPYAFIKFGELHGIIAL